MTLNHRIKSSQHGPFSHIASALLPKKRRSCVNTVFLLNCVSVCGFATHSSVTANTSDNGVVNECRPPPEDASLSLALELCDNFFAFRR